QASRSRNEPAGRFLIDSAMLSAIEEELEESSSPPWLGGGPLGGRWPEAANASSILALNSSASIPFSSRIDAMELWTCSRLVPLLMASCMTESISPKSDEASELLSPKDSATLLNCSWAPG